MTGTSCGLWSESVQYSHSAKEIGDKTYTKPKRTNMDQQDMAFCSLISSTQNRKNNLTQDCEDCHSQQFECRGSYSRLTITQIECLVDMFVKSQVSFAWKCKKDRRHMPCAWSTLKRIVSLARQLLNSKSTSVLWMRTFYLNQDTIRIHKIPTFCCSTNWRVNVCDSSLSSAFLLSSVLRVRRFVERWETNIHLVHRWDSDQFPMKTRLIFGTLLCWKLLARLHSPSMYIG